MSLLSSKPAQQDSKVQQDKKVDAPAKGSLADVPKDGTAAPVVDEARVEAAKGRVNDAVRAINAKFLEVGSSLSPKWRGLLEDLNNALREQHAAKHPEGSPKAPEGQVPPQPVSVPQDDK